MTATPQGLSSRWFIRPSPRPNADVQMFCLPYAGAGASAFRAWPGAFGPRVEVLPVQLPGRESRLREPAELVPAQVAAAIADAASKPFAIFGHSMGGRLGFEVIRQLRRTGGPMPLRLYPSGINPPDLPSIGPLDGLSKKDNEELVARLADSGGIPAVVLDEPELLELFLPVVRSDLTWVDDYVYADEPPLPVPVVAFAGEADTVATPAAMAGWQRHSTVSAVVHPLPGGHFFLHEQLPKLAGIIEPDLLSAVPAA